MNLCISLIFSYKDMVNLIFSQAIIKFNLVYNSLNSRWNYRKFSTPNDLKKFMGEVLYGNERIKDVCARWNVHENTFPYWSRIAVRNKMVPEEKLEEKSREGRSAGGSGSPRQSRLKNARRSRLIEITILINS